MYEAHFGLSSRPFGSKAEGVRVFSGPRQVETMTSLKKGLTALDAVVTVTGPVGVGKTSIVSRALDTISPNRMAAWVGRMQLAPDEVLHLLLAGFGIKAQTKGTIQRFAVFRRLLAERAAAGAPVAIVVEDANRIGVDALAELEALTAADTGDATSANIILMGQPTLKKLLAQPELARLNQRTRLRQAIEPLTQPEVNGYLKHCLRIAGGEYDKIFEAGVAEIVFACSEGIPRMINTLCESAMTTAMEDGLKTVSATLMHKVAGDAFGYEGPLPETAIDTPSEDSVEVPIVEIKVDVADTPAQQAEESDIDREAPPAAETDTASGKDSGQAAAMPDDMDLPSARDMIVESGHYPALPQDTDEPPTAAQADADASAAPDESVAEADADPEFEIPELINDTQPELSALSSPTSDEAVVDELNLDTESTAIQEQLSGDALKALETEAQAEATPPSEPQPEPPVVAESAAAPADQPAPAGKGDQDFDLDAALSFETEATNVMEGLTANLDDVVSDAVKETPVVESANDANGAPALDELPTLTDSMQVDVEKKVEQTKQSDPQAASPEPAAVSQPAEPPAPPKSAEEPAAAAEPKPEPVAGDAAAAAPAAPNAPEEAQSKPIAEVSEMTARIAALDPSNRTNDVDAVEAALDAAKRGRMDELMAPPPLPQVNGNAAQEEEPQAPVPEITLDDAIAQKQEAAAEKRKAFATEIGNANSLEEFSDAMAETLFGDDDFDAIAAEVAANAPAPGELVEPGNGPPDLSLTEESSPAESVADAAPAMPEDTGLKESQQIRADMLQSLNSANTAASQQVADISPAPAAPPASAPQSGQLESIEDQINTSLTQSLEALNITQVADASAAETDEDEEPAKKGGFFSRFRKSS